MGQALDPVELQSVTEWSYGILDRPRDHGIHIVEVTHMDEPHESEQER